jgi:hypothetical protein
VPHILLLVVGILTACALALLALGEWPRRRRIAARQADAVRRGEELTDGVALVPLEPAPSAIHVGEVRDPPPPEEPTAITSFTTRPVELRVEGGRSVALEGERLASADLGGPLRYTVPDDGEPPYPVELAARQRVHLLGKLTGGKLLPHRGRYQFTDGKWPTRRGRRARIGWGLVMICLGAGTFVPVRSIAALCFSCWMVACLVALALGIAAVSEPPY